MELFNVRLEYLQVMAAQLNPGSNPPKFPRADVHVRVAVHGGYGTAAIQRAGEIAIQGVIGSGDVTEYEPVVLSVSHAGTVYVEGTSDLEDTAPEKRLLEFFEGAMDGVAPEERARRLEVLKAFNTSLPSTSGTTASPTAVIEGK